MRSGSREKLGDEEEAGLNTLRPTSNAAFPSKNKQIRGSQCEICGLKVRVDRVTPCAMSNQGAQRHYLMMGLLRSRFFSHRARSDAVTALSSLSGCERPSQRGGWAAGVRFRRRWTPGNRPPGPPAPRGNANFRSLATGCATHQSCSRQV